MPKKGERAEGSGTAAPAGALRLRIQRPHDPVGVAANSGRVSPPITRGNENISSRPPAMVGGLHLLRERRHARHRHASVAYLVTMSAKPSAVVV